MTQQTTGKMLFFVIFNTVA